MTLSTPRTRQLVRRFYVFLSIQWRVYQPQDGMYHSGRSQSQDARRLDAIANDESIHGARNTQSTWLKVQQRFVCSNAARDLIATIGWRLTACQWPVCTGNNTKAYTQKVKVTRPVSQL